MTWDFGIAWSSALWRRRAACWAAVLYSAPPCNCTVEIARASDGLRRYYHRASWNRISVVVHPRLAVNAARRGGRAEQAQTRGRQNPCSCVQRFSLILMPLGSFLWIYIWHLHMGRDSFVCWTCGVLELTWLPVSGALASLSRNWWKPQEGLLFLC